MELAVRYEMCAPSVIAEDFHGDVVILNLDDGRYYNLRCGAAGVWNALMAGATPNAIVDSARRSQPELTQPICQFLNRLSEMQLIRPVAEEATTVTLPTIDWKTISADDKFEIEIFDDLANLILADPIHDVDAEAGWPMPKAA